MKRWISLLLTGIIGLTGCAGAGTAVGEVNVSARASGETLQAGETSQNEAQSQPADQIALDGIITGEIEVSCYDSTLYKAFLEEAASGFEAKYPDASVTVSTFSAMPEVKTATMADGKTIKMMTAQRDPKAESDYINRVNTELMTGGGADVLAIDILPYYKYIENGQLEDLVPYMDADEEFQIEDYQKNILDATKYNGGQYFFPLDYSFEYVAYDKTLLNDEEAALLSAADTFTYDKLAEIGQTAFDRQNATAEDPVKMFSPAGGANMRGGMFNALLDQHYGSIVNIPAKTAHFTDGMFAGILQAVKDYEDKGYISAPVDMAMQGKPAEIGNMDDMLKQMSAKNYLFKTLDQGSMLQYFNTDPTTKNVRISTRGAAGGAMATEDDIVAGLLEYDAGVMFDFSQAYGLNANSDNKSAAWAFIKYLASEEMQLSFSLPGQPVHKNAAAEKAKQQITGELYAPEGNEGASELTEKQTEIYTNYMDTMNKLSQMLNTYVVRDEVIDEMIASETKHFFEGTKTADEVAQNLQGRVELYLNE